MDEGRTFYCYLLAKGFVMRGLKLPEPDILISGITYKTAAPGFMFIFPRPQEGEHMVTFLALEPTADLDDGGSLVHAGKPRSFHPGLQAPSSSGSLPRPSIFIRL